MLVLSFQGPKNIQKEEHNSQRIKVQDGSAQACREYSESQEYRRKAVGTRRRTRLVPFVLPFSGVECTQKVMNTIVSSWKHGGPLDATRHFFDKELPVRRENIFSRRGAACGQRVTTYKISSRRDGLKSEGTRDRKKPLASSLLSECLACHAVLVSNIFSRRRSRVLTLHDHKTSSQRAGHGQMAGA